MCADGPKQRIDGGRAKDDKLRICGAGEEVGGVWFESSAALDLIGEKHTDSGTF